MILTRISLMMFFIVISTNIGALPTVKKSSETGDSLGNTGTIVEDDILIPRTREKRAIATRAGGSRWTNGIVPYEISSVYTSEQQTIITNAMRKIENLTAIQGAYCVRFRPRISSDPYYTKIENGQGCHSDIGQPLPPNVNHTISFAISECLYEVVLIHELLHTLGFSHEQQRPDRDSYVRINLDNINSPYLGDYKKKDDMLVDTLNTTYDFKSIMHYQGTEFSKNGLPTMESIPPNITMGSKSNLSATDIRGIQIYYGCSAAGPSTPKGTGPAPVAFAQIRTSTITTTKPTTTTTTTTQSTTTTKTTTTSTTTTTTKTTTSTNTVSSYCPIPSMNAQWNRNSTIFINPLGQCLSNSTGLCKAQDLYIDNIHNTLYVVDTDNNRIQKYSLNETFNPQQGAIGLTVASKGLIQPQSIFINSQTEDMYILDHGRKVTALTYDETYRVQLWKKSDQIGIILLSEVGEYGFGMYSSYLTLDKEMNIYVGTRHYIRKWLSSTNYTQRIIVAGKNDGAARGPSDLWDPYNFFINNDLTLFIADWQNKRIQKWLFNATEGITILNNLTYIYGLTMGCNGYLYYTDVYEQSVFQLNLTNNEKIRIIGDEQYIPPNKLFFPTIMKFDKFGNIFLIDVGNGYQIRKFSIIQK
ncbi:hypothetical protein I4U23_016683 [Adineta vaga]|nr:hypothetical protein I4U23_016683 [Adineta vaga]